MKLRNFSKLLNCLENLCNQTVHCVLFHERKTLPFPLLRLSPFLLFFTFFLIFFGDFWHLCNFPALRLFFFKYIYSSTYGIALSIISLVEDFQFYQVVSSRDREFQFETEILTRMRGVVKILRLKVLKIYCVFSVNITFCYFTIQYFQRKRLIHNFLTRSFEIDDTNEIGKLIGQWTAASLAGKRFRIYTWAISRESYSNSRSERTFAVAGKEKQVETSKGFPLQLNCHGWRKKICASKPKKSIWDSRPF